MSRKKRADHRVVLPDPKYGQVIVAKMINMIMLSGKRGLAEHALYEAFDRVKEKTKQEAIDVFKKAVSNVQPLVEVRSRRVGGATYQVPTEVRSERGQSLALRWLIQSANERTERRLSERLASEILEAFNNRGGSVKKREDTHRMAEANKAFAHFRW